MKDLKTYLDAAEKKNMVISRNFFISQIVRLIICCKYREISRNTDSQNHKIYCQNHNLNVTCTTCTLRTC